MFQEWFDGEQLTRRNLLAKFAALLFLCATGCAQKLILPTPTLTTVPTISPTIPPPTATPSPQPSKTDVPERLAQQEETLFDIMMKPFINEAIRIENERKKNDPEWTNRIDEDLTKGRVNFLLYGYGDTYEPRFPGDNPPPTSIGSSTILSYDIAAKRFDFISFTHDLRAPEVEQHLREKYKGKPVPAQKIDRAFREGGFNLMRKTHENASGLAIHFQIAFKDIMIQRLIDEVFGGVIVDVPEDFDVQAFYLENVKYPEAHFTKGLQRLNGRQIIQFIKTVPKPPKPEDAYYGKPLEHKSRMYYVFRGLLDYLENKTIDEKLLLMIAGFFTKESRPLFMGGSIENDFDMTSLISNSVQTVIPWIQQYSSKGKKGIGIPAIGKTIYIHDKQAGDGGVRWVEPSTDDTMIQQDFKRGVYPPDVSGLAVPFEADAFSLKPYLDYWPSLRKKIRELLTN